MAINTNYYVTATNATTLAAHINANADTQKSTEKIITALPKEEYPLEAQAQYDSLLISGQLQTSDKHILNQSGNIVTLKGIGMPNGVYFASSVTDISVESEVGEAFYEEVKAKGFNHVRFYLQYEWLNEDSDKADFFNFLNEQISFAEQNGLGVILSLHYFGVHNDVQNDGHFFNGTTSAQNIKDFWQRISDNYKNNNTIIGYGLINEPQLYNSVTRETYLTEEALYNIYQETATAIRNNGDNHLIFIEEPFHKNNDTEYISLKNQSINPDPYQNYDPFLTLKYPNSEQKIPNIVYEFHFYGPTAFTHKMNTGFGELGTQYPYLDYTNYGRATYNGGEYGLEALSNNASWTNYSSGWVDLSNLGQNSTHFVPGFVINDGDGKLQIDDVVITKKEISTNIESNIEVKNSDFSQSRNYLDWENMTPDNTPRYWYYETTSMDENTKLEIQDGALYLDCTSEPGRQSSIKTVGGHNSYLFDIEDGYEYEISFRYKLTENTLSDKIRPMFQVFKEVEPFVYDRTYIENRINTYYRKWAEDNQVPLYCGEFGSDDPSQAISTYSASQEIAWTADMVRALCNPQEPHNSISFSFHSGKDDYIDSSRNISHTKSGFGIMDTDSNAKLAEVIGYIMPRIDELPNIITNSTVNFGINQNIVAVTIPTQVGYSYTPQTSTNLQTWTPITTSHTAGTGSPIVYNEAIESPNKFYRFMLSKDYSVGLGAKALDYGNGCWSAEQSNATYSYVNSDTHQLTYNQLQYDGDHRVGMWIGLDVPRQLDLSQHKKLSLNVYEWNSSMLSAQPLAISFVDTSGNKSAIYTLNGISNQGYTNHKIDLSLFNNSNFDWKNVREMNIESSADNRTRYLYINNINFY